MESEEMTEQGTMTKYEEPVNERIAEETGEEVRASNYERKSGTTPGKDQYVKMAKKLNLINCS